MKYSQFLRWALSHLDVLTVLFTLIQTIISGSLEERAAALKAIIDTLVPVISDFPTAVLAGGEDEEVLETQVVLAWNALPSTGGVEAQAWDGSRLKAIWAVVGPLIVILLGLLK